MSVENAKQKLNRGPGEPTTGYVQASDIQASYDDLQEGWQSDIAAAGGGGGGGVTQEELDAAVAPKADKAYVDQQDALLVSPAELDAATTGKADKTYVDTQDAALQTQIDNLGGGGAATPATVYTSDTEPTGGTYRVGDLWVQDPGGGAALVFRGIWTGTDWGEPSAYPVDVTYTTDPGRPESVVRNDYEANPNNRDTYQVYSNGELTWWVNEWGGLRIRVAENSSWDAALRLIGATNQSGDYLEVQDSTRQVLLMRIKANGGIVAPNVQDPFVIAYGSDPIPAQAQKPCLVGRIGGTTTRYDYFDGPANGTPASGATGWDSVVGEPPVYTSAAAYSGHANGLLCSMNGGLSSYVVKKFPNGGYMNEGYARLRLRVPTTGDRNAKVFSTEATTGGHRHPIRINTSNKVEITSYDGTTILATSTTTLTVGQWYDLGVYWNRGTTTSNGSCIVRIYATVSSDTPSETLTVSAGNFFGAGGDIWALRWGLQASNAGTNLLHIGMVAWSPDDWPTSTPPEGTASLFLHDGAEEIPIAGGGGSAAPLILHPGVAMPTLGVTSTPQAIVDAWGSLAVGAHAYTDGLAQVTVNTATILVVTTGSIWTRIAKTGGTHLMTAPSGSAPAGVSAYRTTSLTTAFNAGDVSVLSPDGVKVPGGAAGKVLTSDASGVGTWQDPPAGGAWGSIGGTLSSQTDLWTELQGKASTNYVDSEDAALQAEIDAAETRIGALEALGGLKVSVLAHGAKGDGSADDTAAIQAAISAAGVGGTVLFPKASGYYKVSASLKPLERQTWVGEHSPRYMWDEYPSSVSAIRAASSFTGTALIHNTATVATGVTIQNLALIGNGESGTLNGIDFGPASGPERGWYVNRCSFNAFGGAALCGFMQVVTVRDCHMARNGYGIRPVSGADANSRLNDCMIENNYLYFNYHGGLYMDGAVECGLVTISGNRFERSGAMITGNTLDPNANRDQNACGVFMSKATAINVEGNTTDANARQGLRIDGLTRGAVNNCTFWANVWKRDGTGDNAATMLSGVYARYSAYVSFHGDVITYGDPNDSGAGRIAPQYGLEIEDNDWLSWDGTIQLQSNALTITNAVKVNGTGNYQCRIREPRLRDSLPVQSTADAPTPALQGDQYYDTTLRAQRFYDGTTWQTGWMGWSGTQAEYDAIPTKRANTLYVIV